MSSAIAIVLLSVATTFSPADAPITTAQIDRAIKELGDDRFGVRQRASLFLWETGKEAEPALRKAMESPDAEVVARARRILRNFDYGIYPDTPEEVVGLIAQFRFGNVATRQAVLKKVVELEETPTVLKLLSTVPDEKTRQELTVGLMRHLDKLAGAMLLGEDRAKIEQLLELGAVHDPGMRNYAAYLLVCGQLDARIEKLRQPAVSTESPAPGNAALNIMEAKLLAHLLRAKGDLPGARKAAELAKDATLLESIDFELGNWAPIAQSYDRQGRDAEGNLAGGIVHLGYTAAFHHLAGNAKELDEAVVALRELAVRKPNKLWYCCEALLINERYQDAVDLCRQSHPASAFEILCLQQRFREAFAVVGVKDFRHVPLPWMGQRETIPQPVVSIARSDRFEMGIRVASMLHRLGEREQAEQLFSELAAVASDEKNLSIRPVCLAEHELGLRDRAMQHARVALSEAWNTSVLRTLFPQRSGAAELWWEFLCDRDPHESRRETIDRLGRLLLPGRHADAGDDDWLGLVHEAERAAGKLDKADRAKWFAALAEVCLAHADARRARAYFQNAAETVPSADSMIRLADLLAAVSGQGDGQWQRAADWYAAAWAADSTRPIALYLQGRALVQAGRESEGRRLIDIARLVPLGNADARSEFAEQLLRRGHDEEAARQWDVALRTGEFQSAGVCAAADHVARIAAGTEHAKAAVYWQWARLRCLKTSTNNLGVAGYLRRAHQIHKARARALLAAGEIDAAIAEIEVARLALPGEVPLALDLVPALEKADRGAAADELFKNIYEVNRLTCADFPRSAAHHHALARLAVGCNRQLDAARKHAQQAVQLEPGNEVFRATLKGL
ncbi:MAG: hypothetical protein HQ567_04640 [Candidatus Nealsonbacteria bacterium]|nr:hypothetical protein [Candidatus Nealsonbacteria bacterium]